MRLPDGAASPSATDLHVGIAVRGRRVGVAVAGADGTLRVLGCRPRAGSPCPRRPVQRLLARVLRSGRVVRIVAEDASEGRRSRARVVALTASILGSRHRIPFETLSYPDLAASFLPEPTTAVVPLLRTLIGTFEPLSRYGFIRVPRCAHVAKVVAAAIAIRSVQRHL